MPGCGTGRSRSRFHGSRESLGRLASPVALRMRPLSPQGSMGSGGRNLRPRWPGDSRAGSPCYWWGGICSGGVWCLLLWVTWDRVVLGPAWRHGNGERGSQPWSVTQRFRAARCGVLSVPLGHLSPGSVPWGIGFGRLAGLHDAVVPVSPLGNFPEGRRGRLVVSEGLVRTASDPPPGGWLRVA